MADPRTQAQSSTRRRAQSRQRAEREVIQSQIKVLVTIEVTVLHFDVFYVMESQLE